MPRFSPNEWVACLSWPDLVVVMAPSSQLVAIKDAVFWLIISKYTSSVMVRVILFSICSISPALNFSAVLEICSRASKSLIPIILISALLRIKSPIRTDILFFQTLFMDGFPRLRVASSTTSSWIRVAICSSSIMAAAR